jgi:hypothetical protein
MPLLSTSPRRVASSRVNVLSARWWVRDGNGDVSVAQWPNPALAVWLLAVALGWTGALGSGRTATLDAVGSGALVAWAFDELVRGASPVRRVMGAVVLTVELVHLFG